MKMILTVIPNMTCMTAKWMLMQRWCFAHHLNHRSRHKCIKNSLAYPFPFYAFPLHALPFAFTQTPYTFLLNTPHTKHLCSIELQLCTPFCTPFPTISSENSAINLQKATRTWRYLLFRRKPTIFFFFSLLQEINLQDGWPAVRLL